MEEVHDPSWLPRAVAPALHSDHPEAPLSASGFSAGNAAGACPGNGAFDLQNGVERLSNYPCGLEMPKEPLVLVLWQQHFCLGPSNSLTAKLISTGRKPDFLSVPRDVPTSACSLPHEAPEAPLSLEISAPVLHPHSHGRGPSHPDRCSRIAPPGRGSCTQESTPGRPSKPCDLDHWVILDPISSFRSTPTPLPAAVALSSAGLAGRPPA
mmetsp:Transcript_20448/g.48517  ORF Transcript_20448/g.48517 Transcript_20448/m.48517 type:complete len:210 (+) Transcript_20448:255-884(+)